MSARARAAAVLVLALVWCAGAGAFQRALADAGPDAEELYQDAVRALNQLRLEQALPLLDRAWRAGDNTPERVRELFERAGETAATIGDRAAARDWFRRLVALDPHAELPAGTSPKIVALLEQARHEMGGQSLGVEVRARVGSAGAVDIQVTDPAGLAEALEIRAPDPVEQRVGGRSHWTLALDHAVSGPAVVTVRDRFHNALLVERVELTWPRGGHEQAGQPQRDRAPRVSVGRTALPPPEPRPRWYARWQTWAVGSGALLGTGAVLAALSLSARSDLDDLNHTSPQHEGSEAVAAERRMQRTAIAAEVAAGAAALAGVAALFCWRRESSLRAAPMVVDHAAGVSLEGRF